VGEILSIFHSLKASRVGIGFHNQSIVLSGMKSLVSTTYSLEGGNDG
jgi:hypothetical protein